MNKIIVYQKDTCSKCMKLNEILKSKGIDYISVDYNKENLTANKLKNLLSKMNLRAEDLLRKSEKNYEEVCDNSKQHSESELIDIMVKFPNLIQRPIVECGDKAILARPPELVEEIL